MPLPFGKFLVKMVTYNINKEPMLLSSNVILSILPKERTGPCTSICPMTMRSPENITL